MHRYAHATEYPTQAQILAMGYSYKEAQNTLRAIKENGGEPHYWWMSLADGAKK